MNRFGLEPNSVNLVSDLYKIWLQAKSVHTDYEQLKSAVQFRYLFSESPLLWKMSLVRGVVYDVAIQFIAFFRCS
jgi:hypothetical protein